MIRTHTGTDHSSGSTGATRDVNSTSLRCTWWNGFYYSQWQLLDLRWASRRIADLGSPPDRMGAFSVLDRATVARMRRRAALLVAIEGRYYPEIADDHISIRPDIADEWRGYRSRFDAVATLARVGWSPEELPFLADGLARAAKTLSPFGSKWRHLIRHAGQSAWDDLEGDALVALDYLRAAEMVIRCFEDCKVDPASLTLGQRFQGEQLRISNRHESLDNSLARLGLSPHPRAVLIVEGETEELLAPRVQKHLHIPADTRTVRILTMRSASRDLTKLAAFAAAPLIEHEDSDRALLRMSRPPTFILVAIDPDTPFDTTDGIADEHRKIVDELEAVVAAQGYEAKRSDLDQLIVIRTWTDGSFEFNHFTDEELVDAIADLDPTWTRKTLAVALAGVRRAGGDIKKVIGQKGRRSTSKRALAEKLWPVLREKIDRAEADPDHPMPEIALRLLDAYSLSRRVNPAAYWIASAANTDDD